MNDNPLNRLSVAELQKLLKSSNKFYAFEAQRELCNRDAIGTYLEVENPYNQMSCAEMRKLAYKTTDQVERYGLLREEAGRMMQTLRKTHWGHFPLWRWLLNAIGCRA